VVLVPWLTPDYGIGSRLWPRPDAFLRATTGRVTIAAGGLFAMTPLDRLRSEARWLLDHAHDITSQFGEDGIIAKALELLPERNRWCIEFGAWDGRECSNTYALTQKGYRGVFIEANKKRFRKLQHTHGNGRHVLLNALVGFDANDNLDAVLDGRSIPYDPDVLSIDIDGNDFHVWDAAKKYRPKLVVIEYNPTMANSVRFVQERRSGVTQGASALALVELAKSKEYELIAATFANLLFVDRALYPLFHIPDNSLALIRDDSAVPHIFIGFDGHVFLSQNNETGGIPLPWHPLVLLESKVQMLSKAMQKHPDTYTKRERLVLRWKNTLRGSYCSAGLRAPCPRNGTARSDGE
jgi:hypothetical protein